MISIDEIEEGEIVEFFDSSGVGHRKAGNYLSDRRIGSYWLDGTEDDRHRNSARFEDIADTSLETDRGLTFSDQITVTLHDGTTFFVHTNGDDFTAAFYAELEERVIDAQ